MPSMRFNHLVSLAGSKLDSLFQVPISCESLDLHAHLCLEPKLPHSQRFHNGPGFG